MSAIVASPSELVVLHQQKSGNTLLEQTQKLYKAHGAWPVFSRGLGITALRDSVFTGCSFGISPVLCSYLLNDVSRC